MGSFQGKKILVLGIANERSIAWSIAQSLHQEGAELCLTYVNEAIERRLRPLAESLGCTFVEGCDVQSDQHLDALFAKIEEKWGVLHGVVHSIAYAEREDLQNRFIQTTRKGFHTALDVSAYSLVAIAARAEKLMKEGGSILTMTYLGAERAVPHYNVMGMAKAALESAVRYLAVDLGPTNIRVNALSAGPIKTLAAAGIPQFRDLLTSFGERAPLKRTVSLEDVSGSAMFLLGSHSSGVTGETLYVDCGYNILGL